MKRLAALCDNAMLYKDLTQWIRSKTFFTLFIGLLTIGEFIAVMFAYLDLDGAPAGPPAFGFLVALLALYLLIIAFQGMALTSKEFGNRTFELYEMAGMSLEKMVFGKFSSMMAQFLFGFFCIVPFMFFSYLLGGLDFFTILGLVLLISFFAPPLFLVFLAIAFMQKGKAANVLGRLFSAFFMLIFIYSSSGLFFAMSIGRRGLFGGGPAALVNWLLGFSFEVFAIAATILVLQALVCLLAFFIACHNISPVCDSRETAVKLLASALCAAWMLFIGALLYFNPSVHGEAPAAVFGLAPLYLIMLLIGLIFFYTPLNPPRMAALRRDNARLALRPFYRYYAPGPAGTVATLSILIGAAIAFVVFLFAHTPPSTGEIDRLLMYMISLPLQVPFFIVFPAGWLFNFRRFSERPRQFRLAVFLWWILTAAAMMLARSIVKYVWRNNDLTAILDFASLFVSPVSSVFIGWDPSRESNFNTSAPTIRIITGIVGLILMFRTIARRRKLEARIPATPIAPHQPEIAISPGVPEAID